MPAKEPPEEAFIITTENEWPLHIYEGEGHVRYALAQNDRRRRAFRCKIIVIEEVQLVSPKPYLEPTAND